MQGKYESRIGDVLKELAGLLYGEYYTRCKTGYSQRWLSFLFQFLNEPNAVLAIQEFFNNDQPTSTDEREQMVSKIIVQKLLFVVLLGTMFCSLVFGEGFAQVTDNSAIETDQAVDSQDPPLRSSTTFGTYIVELDWEPASPGIENETTFRVVFLDESGEPLSSTINYDFTIAAADLSPIAEFYNQTTDGNGSGMPIRAQFGNPGPVEITIWTNPAAGSESQSESATFNFIVTPEFSVAMPILVLTAITIAVITIVTRIGRQFGRMTV